MCHLTRAASLGSGVDKEHSRSSIRLQRERERELQAVSGFGVNVPVSASGVIARSLSNELKDAFNDGCFSDKTVLDRVVC